MGVLPLEFTGMDDVDSFDIDGTETYSLPGLNDDLAPGQELDLVIRRSDGSESIAKARVRVDTAIEAQYYRHGGILPFVLRKLLSET